MARILINRVSVQNYAHLRKPQSGTKLPTVAIHEVISDEFLKRFEPFATEDGLVTYADFSRVALYDPDFGYYQSNQERVGKADGTDFYTSVSVGPVFGQLVAAAARKLVGDNQLDEYTLVEMGAEPSGGMFNRVDTGFGESRTFRLGQTPKIPNRSVLVANEVLDAQPFHRLEFRGGEWREWGVNLSPEGLSEEILPELSEPVQQKISPHLPPEMPEGYRLDLSIEAESLVESWCDGDWQGAIILIDYGKSWQELIEATAQGTARAYLRHQQTNALLQHPGQQDLTTHVCWDRIETCLDKQKFTNICLRRQESFLVHEAWTEIERLSQELGESQSASRGQIQSLLHPSGFGSKFQVQYAVRK
ncbi:MAG: SAM-dependent methyltransferase [Verrucomicrobiota bacterium]